MEQFDKSNFRTFWLYKRNRDPTEFMCYVKTCWKLLKYTNVKNTILDYYDTT